MKTWIASDSTHGRMLTVDTDETRPTYIALKYGRGERGEIVHIWDDDNTDRTPDHLLYWDDQHGEYRTYSL